MANNTTYSSRFKHKRDTAANWEKVKDTFQPFEGELIVVDTAAGATRFKVGRYDSSKSRLLYYGELPFTDEYLYSATNEKLGQISEIIDGKAPKSHTHTKTDVGLGNVDNTADTDKSVKYATSAGSADSITGVVDIAHGGTGAITRSGSLCSLINGGRNFTGDINTLTDTGVYWINLSNCTNGPASSGYGTMEVISYEVFLQRFTFYNTGTIYYRTYTNSQWYDWHAVAMSSDEYRIRYKNIPDGADLNNDTYKEPGYYRSTQGQNKILNAPTGLRYGAFELVVTGISDGAYCTQTVKDFELNRSWVRTQTTWKKPWVWTDWTEIITTDIGEDYYARLQSPNNLIHAGNEFTFAAPKLSNDIWLNYRTASGNLDGNIGTYLFGNGKGDLASIKVNGIYADTLRWKTLWSGKLTSGSATITDAAKYAAILVSGHPGKSEDRVHVCLPTGGIDCQITSNTTFLYFGTTYSGDDCTITLKSNPSNGNIDYVWGLVRYRV